MPQPVKALRPELRSVLGENNLVSATSASGTTSTLLASANTFSPGLAGESLKQCLMATAFESEVRGKSSPQA